MSQPSNSPPPPWKTGHILSTPSTPVVKFKDIRAKPNAALGASSTPDTMTTYLGKPVDLPDIPSAMDNQSELAGWQMLGNDNTNNCDAVAWANMRRVVTAKLARREEYPNQDLVDAYYRIVNPGFQRHVKGHGPGSKDDHGMTITDPLDALLNGSATAPDGAKPIAYVKVDPTNLDEVHAAIATFGCLVLGIVTTTQSQNEHFHGQPWTFTPSSKLDTPHVVMAGAYGSQISFVSWGRIGTFSDSFWNGVPSNPDYSRMILQAYVVIWPEHIGTRRFLAGIDAYQLRAELGLNIGSGKLDDTVFVNPTDSLWMVQVKDTPGTTVQILHSPASTGYATLDWTGNTQLALTDVANGTLAFDSTDLYFIKTQNTGNGNVEVHRMTRESQFAAYDLHTTTVFGPPANNGFFTIDNGDLYNIQLSKTNTNQVEVHVADHRDNFSTWLLHTATAFDVIQPAYGDFRLRNGDLYFIKKSNTDSGKVEVQIADGEHNYQNIRKYVTWCDGGADPSSVCQNGIWDIGSDGNLYFIRNKNPESGSIEVHVATASSNYVEAYHYATVFGANLDALAATWLMGVS